ncbi:MAG: thioredoxin [Proteobacteria bacterium]|nr:thioredoxin [Pseudomonadota bacterium]
MSELLKTANDTDFEDVVLKAEGQVLVDFWAEWCGPCRTQTPILEKFATKNEDVTIVKVNVDESPGIAQALGIRSIPTLVVFEGGQALVGAMGVQNAPALKGRAPGRHGARAAARRRPPQPLT